MATDFGEKERAFIDGLKENTGRDLGEWMQAITAAGLPHRNDIIDWLRHKGFMFSKASWLERIHHNGGASRGCPGRGVGRCCDRSASTAAAGCAHLGAGTCQRSRGAPRQGQGVSTPRPARSGKGQVGSPRRRFHDA